MIALEKKKDIEDNEKTGASTSQIPSDNRWHPQYSHQVQFIKAVIYKSVSKA